MNRFHGPPGSQMVSKKTTVIGQAGPPNRGGGGPDHYPSVLLNGNQISASAVDDGINSH